VGAKGAGVAVIKNQNVFRARERELFSRGMAVLFGDKAGREGQSGRAV